jgi:hypothetical protein
VQREMDFLDPGMWLNEASRIEEASRLQLFDRTTG